MQVCGFQPEHTKIIEAVKTQLPTDCRMQVTGWVVYI